MSAAPEPVQLDVFQARDRTARRHSRQVERLIPLAQELALKAGAFGVTWGDIRLVAEQRGLLLPGPPPHWGGAVPRAAGLVSTGRRRLCVQSRTRNDQVIYVLKGT